MFSTIKTLRCLAV